MGIDARPTRRKTERCLSKLMSGASPQAKELIGALTARVSGAQVDANHISDLVLGGLLLGSAESEAKRDREELEHCFDGGARVSFHGRYAKESSSLR